MAAKTRPVARVSLALFLVCILFLTAQTGSVHAAPNGDSVIYVVKAGDRLVDIAGRYGITASAIVRANSLSNADTIFPGQRLIIPAASGGAPSSGGSTGGSTWRAVTYTVQLGDTLASIARKYGVSAAVIQQTNNNSNPNTIWVGQKLVIPGASGAATPPPTPTSQPAPEKPASQPASQTIHAVKAGETLSQIARQYGVSVEALVSTNGLGSADMIRVGMRLIIPGKGSSGSTGSAPTGRATKFVASISQQRCWLYSGETVIGRWICSTGRRGAATMPGTFKIQSKIAKAYGSTWNIWMPFWLGIYWAGASENGIHGLPWDAESGVQIWSGNVGKPITFGCVMLDNVNAKMLYDMSYIGMPVVIRP